jgi:thiamine transport system substrate-binding protein
MRTTMVLAAALAAAPAWAQQKPELVIYTYESFVSEWGPGPAIAENFEALCGCTLRFVGAGDGAALIGRLKLEGDRSPADVVLGLDTNLTAEAKADGLVVPHGLEVPALALPIAWEDDAFLPYDWGYFAFVYDVTKMPEPPTSFEALIASDASIVIHDPRSSTPGLGLLMWVKDAYGDRTARPRRCSRRGTTCRSRWRRSPRPRTSRSSLGSSSRSC